MENNNNNKMNRRIGIPAAAILLLLISMPGCGGADNITQRRDDSDAVGRTPTRIINALVGTASEPVIASITAPEALKRERLPTGSATGYADVNAGPVTFVLTDGAADNPLTLASVEVPVGTAGNYSTLQSRSVVVFGVAGAAVGSNQAPQAFVLSDPKKPEDLGDKFAAVRVVSVALHVPPLSLYSDALPVLGATSITLKNPTNYVRVDAGDAKLSLRAGSDTLTLPTLARGTKLQAGKAYTLLLYGVSEATQDATLILEAVK